MDKATQGAPKWPTLDKTKASFAEPAQIEHRKPRIILSLSSTVSTCHKHKGEHNHQSKTKLKMKKKREKGRNEPSCLYFGLNIWQLPF